ncbi:MAG: iron-sulfur cluster assembly protein [Opitutales bacterium]
MTDEPVLLLRNCKATQVPDGDQVVLREGDRFFVKQALGGNVTLQSNLGIFQVAREEAEALGPEVAALLAEVAEAPPAATEGRLEDRVWAALRQCFDPEIPVNIVDLGLIYDLVLEEGEAGRQRANIQMTLTTQGCGMGPAIANDARQKVESVDGIHSAEVSIVWDPPWNPRMISDAGKAKLGLE